MSTGTPYKQFRADGVYDAIVIGSGIGGLSTAALLAKHARQRVLVLERHYTAGGFTHVFTRPGFEWDVGVHYVGQASEPKERARRIFDHLSEGRLQWADMGEVYDAILIDGRRYDLPKGKEAWRAAMKGYFPAQGEAIDRYLAEVHAAARSVNAFFAEKAVPSFAQRVIGRLLRRKASRYASRTVAQVLDTLTDDAELRAVLTGQWGDYGLPPSLASFLMHALVVTHYMGGAAYPVGGSARFVETILPTIEAAGGTLLVRAEVQEICVEDGRAVGVRMADGKVLRAKRVISAAGAAVTYGRLLPEAVQRSIAAPASVQSVPNSGAHFSLYVGLDRTAEQLGLSRTNLWVYDHPDHDRSAMDFMADPDADFPVVYISFPSAKDPDFERRYPGKATIEVITMASYGWFRRWEDTAWGHRGDDYDALKARIQQRLLQALVRQCPQIEGHVAHVELSTPLSTRHFTGHPEGAIYGMAHTPARFADRALQPRTPIRGLYLAGSDVCTAGVLGATMGGVLAASCILRRNVLASALRGHEPAAQPSAQPAHASA